MCSSDLLYSVNGGAWQRIAAALQTDANDLNAALVRASLPGQATGAVTQFYFELTDGAGRVSFCPAAGPDSRALVKTDDRQSRAGIAHNLRIVMTANDYNFMLRDTNLMSNQKLKATVVYKESETFFDCGIRLRGSPWGRPSSEAVGFTLFFPQDHKFQIGRAHV